MRLIDADALMAQLKAIRIRSNDLTIDYKRGHSDGIITAVEYADDAPTADAAPVVRCMECKRNRDCFIKEMIIAETKQDNPYCSCGQRWRTSNSGTT